MTDTILSKEAYERLAAELNDLTTRGRVEIARAIEAARALGDLSENGDYHAAKDAQGKMESRIRHLQAMLSSATVAEHREDRSDSVIPGSIVTLRYEGDSSEERYLIGSIEERPAGVTVMSPGSPLGKALLGRKAGDKVEYEAPGGVLRVEVVGLG